MKRLTDKIAIISGAGRGIGFAGAQAFVREGAKVVLAEINEELGRKAEAALRAGGGEATFIRTDVADSASVQALMARTEQLYGGLHVLCNNASVFLIKQDAPVTELAEAIWAKVLAINLHSIFLCCKYGIPLMVTSGGGSVINTGSRARVMGIPGCDAYTATKPAPASGPTAARRSHPSVEPSPWCCRQRHRGSDSRRQR